MANSTEAKLNVKTKLLLNKVSTALNLAIDSSVEMDKRTKNMDKVFETCSITFRPFYKKEDKDLVTRLDDAQTGGYQRVLHSLSTGGDISSSMNKIFEYLKTTLYSRKLNLEVFENFWNSIEK